MYVSEQDIAPELSKRSSSYTLCCICTTSKYYVLLLGFLADLIPGFHMYA